jgi:hypothetical protein
MLPRLVAGIMMTYLPGFLPIFLSRLLHASPGLLPKKVKKLGRVLSALASIYSRGRSNG